MRSHARKSRDMSIERWRQLLYRVRVCKQCLDCAICVGGHERDVSSSAAVAAVVLSPVTTMTAYPSSSAAAAAASVASSSTKLLVACKFYEQKANLSDQIIVMDDDCLSHITRHTSQGSGPNELERLKDECQRLQNQQKQKQHVVEVYLPTDPEALWKVSGLQCVTRNVWRDV
jgi:hypothetical protein